MRESASKRGHDRAWRRLQLQHLIENPLYVDCLDEEPGIATAATDVHNVVAIRLDPSRRLDPSKLMSLASDITTREPRGANDGTAYYATTASTGLRTGNN